MKLWRILIAGLVITVFNTAFAMVTCGWFFRWVYALKPTDIWKPMNGPPPTAYYISAVVISILFALVYAILNKGIPGKIRLLKGIVFGLCVWAVGILPGMAAMYFFMTINPVVVLYWTLLGLVQTPLAGIIIAAIYGK
ncbi:MAG: hypothetical protein ACYSRZ_01985 [Planctomycetota bacterium]|jgi:uncharacterized membrane protein YagU involved in acid resistance